MKHVDLDAITFEVTQTKDKTHAFVVLTAVAGKEVPDTYRDPRGDPLRAVWVARRRAANILARVGLEAVSDLDDIETFKPHGCRPHRNGSFSCYVAINGPLLAPLGSDWVNDGPPSIWCSVPADQADAWVARLRGYLAAIVADDALLPAEHPTTAVRDLRAATAFQPAPKETQ